MKKFIISFEYNGFVFSAKVLVKRNGDKILISTALCNEELAFLFDNHSLMFVQNGKGFQLLLFKADRSIKILSWKIQLAYMDKEQMVDGDVFSLS